MYLDFKVKIPSDSVGITRKKIKGTTYIYYAYEHNCNSKCQTRKGIDVRIFIILYITTFCISFFPAISSIQKAILHIIW